MKETEARALPTDMATAPATLTSAVDHPSRSPPVDHRPAVDYPKPKNPAVVAVVAALAAVVAAAAAVAAAAVVVVAAAVVAAVAVAERTARHPGELLVPGPTGPGASPYCPCTTRMAYQYL